MHGVKRSLSVIAGLVSLCLAIMALPGPVGAAAVFAPVGQIGPAGSGVCTAEAIRPDLVLTASHCVGSPGAQTVVVFYGQTTQDVKTFHGIVVFDGVNPQYTHWVDMALVKLTDGTWPAVLDFSEAAPTPGETLHSVSFSLGIRQWTTDVTYVDEYFVEGFGWADLAIGALAPGASGSVLLKDGKIVSMVNIGYDPLHLFGGVPGWELRAGVAWYDDHGPMKKPKTH